MRRRTLLVGDSRAVVGLATMQTVTLMRIGQVYYLSQLPQAALDQLSMGERIPRYPAGKAWLRVSGSATDSVSRFVIEMAAFGTGLVDLSLLDLPGKQARVTRHIGGLTVFEVPFSGARHIGLLFPAHGPWRICS